MKIGNKCIINNYSYKYKKINEYRGIFKYFLMFLLLFLILYSFSAWAAEIYVDDDGGKDYTTIQAAINAADPGDTIFVYNGTYNENVLVNKTINLIGNSSSECIIKSAALTQPVMDINSLADSSNISGFKLIDANGTNSFGLRITSAENCNLIDIIISNVTTVIAGNQYTAYGLFISNVKNTTFNDFQIYFINGSDSNDIAKGIGVEPNSFNNTFMNCKIENISSNSSSSGISSKYSDNNSFYNITIKNIWCDTYSNGITKFGCYNNTVSNCFIENITGNDVGSTGIKTTNALGLSLLNNTINNSYYGTHFTVSGIGQNIDNDVLIYGNSIIKNNTIDTTDDGIILNYWNTGRDMYNDSICEIGYLEVSENNITTSGNGIEIERYEYIGYDLFDNASFSLGDLKIINNDINSFNQGIFFEPIHHVGYNLNNNSTCSIGAIEISNNTLNIGCNDGFYFNDINYIGCNISDNASFSMNDFISSFNEINVGNFDGIEFNVIEKFGYNLSGDSYCEIGDFKVNNNIINGSSGEYGIYLASMHYFGNYMMDSSSFKMGDIQFNNNLINTSNDGINIGEIGEFGYELYNNSYFKFGDIEFNENNITSTDIGINVSAIYYFGNYLVDDSIFYMGNISFNDNSINSEQTGIYVFEFDYFGYDMDDNSSMMMGDIEFNDNTINSNSKRGIEFEWIYEFGFYMYNYSNFEMENIEINNNNITSAWTGIYIGDIMKIGNEMYNNSVFDMNNFEFNENNITCSDYGLVVNGIYAIGKNNVGNSSFVMNSIEFNENIITSDDNGFYIKSISSFFENPEGTSSFIMKNITLNDNILDSGQSAIRITDINEFGDELYNESTFEMYDFQLCNNSIVAQGDGILFEGVNGISIGTYLKDNSSFIMRDFKINDNNISSLFDDGIKLTQFDELRFGFNLTDNSTFTMNNFEIKNNIINASDEGIYLNNKDFGKEVLDNSVFNMNDIKISDNLIENCNIGLYLKDSNNITVNENTIKFCDFGINLSFSSNNTISNNNIDNSNDSIYLYQSNNNTITENFVNNSGYNSGLTLELSDNNNILSNSFLNSRIYGFFVYKSDNNQIGNNIIRDTAISNFGSCPFLYTWNGTEMKFFGDINGPGGLSYTMDTSIYGGGVIRRAPTSTDYTAIDSLDLVPIDGSYLIEVAEDSDEISYFDHAQLWVIDHAEGVEIYSPEAALCTDTPYLHPPVIHTVRNPVPPISATDRNGEDILSIISSDDDIYTESDILTDNFITLDLGDLSGASQIKLIYRAYSDWSPIGKLKSAQYVEVKNNLGEWELVSDTEHFGKPEALPRTYVIDITDWFKTDDWNIRLHTGTVKIHVDWIAIDTTIDEPVDVTVLEPTSAEHYYKGVPGVYEYFCGNFTKYGDVLTLLEDIDDKYVIMRVGDSVKLKFIEQPTPSADRDFILFTDVYFKQPFVKYLLGNDISTVNPIPFHAMSNYPYQLNETYPNDTDHLLYLSKWNTREYDNKDRIGMSLPDSNYNIVFNNTIIGDSSCTGLHLDNETNTSLLNNNIYNVQNGIWVYNSDKIIVEGNLVHNNSDDGIELFSSTNCKIILNDLENNSNYGVKIMDSANNSIYHNSFVNNNGNKNQSYDNSINNIWHDGYPSGGNYWSDYNGNDIYSGVNQDQMGSDKIGDIPYDNITGTTDNDTYPLFYEFANYYTLSILAPTQINEGKYFTVKITDFVGAEMENVNVTFNSITEQTNTNGIVNFSAPSVSSNTDYTILVSKNEYLSNSTIITVNNQEYLGGGGGGGLHPTENQEPIANANGPYNGVIGKTITFDGTSSYDPDGIITNYSWTFGDGAEGYGKKPVHIYTAGGTYSITLTVTDDNGETDIDYNTSAIISDDSDADNDGLSDEIEELIGTDPKIKTSYIFIDIENLEKYLIDTDDDVFLLTQLMMENGIINTILTLMN